MFQSLIGILGNFNDLCADDENEISEFQSLIGILGNFNRESEKAMPKFVLVSIPNRDFRKFQLASKLYPKATIYVSIPNRDFRKFQLI